MSFLKFQTIDHFTRCKQHWSRSTSCFSFLTLRKSWDKIQPTEHLKLNKKVKQTSLRCFLYTWNKENSYKLKQEVLLDQSCLRLVKWSIGAFTCYGNYSTKSRRGKYAWTPPHVVFSTEQLVEYFDAGVAEVR